MADITCCQGEGCPMKKDCYRFTARKDEYMQTYFTEPPIKDGECEYFWDIGNSDVSKNRYKPKHIVKS